jgi:hypothetical protein
MAKTLFVEEYFEGKNAKKTKREIIAKLYLDGLFGSDVPPEFHMEGYRLYRTRVGCLLTQRAMLSLIQRSKNLRGELAMEIWSFLGSMEFYVTFNPKLLQLRWDHGVLPTS